MKITKAKNGSYELRAENRLENEVVDMVRNLAFASGWEIDVDPMTALMAKASIPIEDLKGDSAEMKKLGLYYDSQKDDNFSYCTVPGNDWDWEVASELRPGDLL